MAGEPLELRATTANGAVELWVEVELDGSRTRLRAEPFGRSDGAATASGHLAAAAAAAPAKGRLAWSVTIQAPPAGRPLRYRFASGERTTRWYEVASAAWGDGGGRLRINGTPADRVDPASIRWLVRDGRPVRARFALRLDPDDHVVGFGERFDHLDQRGRSLDATVFEQYKAQGNRTYMPMPFAIVAGGSGWGFHVDTYRRTRFDVGSSDPTRLRVEVEMNPDGTEEEVVLRLFAGPPSQVLDAFVGATGRPVVPPDWVFRLWMSGNEWNTQARVMSEVARSVDLDIPAGVVVIEAWSDESTFTAFRDARYEPHPDGSPHRLGDFEFPGDGAWPDPKGMVDDLHRLGIRVLLWQIPLQKALPAPRGQARYDSDRMLRSGYAVTASDGLAYRNRGWWFPQSLMPDFTNDEAKEWWLSKRRYLVEDVGVDGFKTDGGEHAWGEDLRYRDGTRGVAGNNRYPVLYQAAYHELLTDDGRDAVTFSRAGFTGAAAYPCHWAGDEDSTWEAFRASITAGLTAGASGVFFWGWDLAGFSGEVPSAELYLRAAAMACFCPIMQFHSEFNHHRSPSRDRTPWNIAARHGDSRVIPVFRRFAKLRERLVPYLRREAAKSVERSTPLMRALFFEHPADPAVWHWPLEYLLGDHLLVAPVTAPGQETWPVYLPAGRWIDLWSGSTVEGPATVTRDARLTEIPVYVKTAAWPNFRDLTEGLPAPPD